MLDPLIHQSTRLRIMATLYKNREVSFLRLRDALALTEGNLGTHVQKLRDAGYVASRQTLTTRGFEVHYVLTRQGAEALLAYIAEIQRLLAIPGSAAQEASSAAPKPPSAADAPR